MARNKNESELQKEVERLSLLEFVPANIVVSDSLEILQTQGDISPFCKNVSKSIGANLLKIICPELAKELSRAIEEARKTFQKVEQKGLGHLHNDELKSYSLKVLPMKLKSSEERFFSIFIEETKEQKYRDILNSAHEGILVINPEGHIEFTNKRLEEMLGWSKRELMGKPYNMLIPEERRKKQKASEKKYMQSPNKRLMGEDLDIFINRKNGSTLPVDILISPFESEGISLITCIIRDISEVRELKIKRNQIIEHERSLRIQAEKNIKIKDDFLAVVSHELRTPLTTIISWAQLLLSKKIDKEKARKAFKAIESSALTQDRLIDDLLDTSRIQAGKMPLELKELDPDEPLFESIHIIQPLADAKKITIETTIASKSNKIWGDSHRLNQVYWNILSNAVKFTPVGGKIEIKSKQVKSLRGNYIKTEIKDNGVGIEKKFLPRIFDRFSQQDNNISRVGGGLGLGMSIVKGLIEIHGGRVKVQSPGAGKGSTFSVSFPLAKSEDINFSSIQDQKKFKNNKSKGKIIKFKSLNILILAKEIPMQEYLAFMSKNLGAEVREASSYEKALELWEMFRPDIIVNYLSNTKDDGLDLAYQLRSQYPDENLKDMRLLALSNFIDPNKVQNLLNSGYDAHFPMPMGELSLSCVFSALVKNEQGRTSEK